MPPRAPPFVVTNSTCRGIPEPFIWYSVLTLAETGLAMECGHQTLNGVPPGYPATAGTGWLPDLYRRDNWEIIHRDIKPKNVFLGLPVAHHFASYPTPKVGHRFVVHCL